MTDTSLIHADEKSQTEEEKEEEKKKHHHDTDADADTDTDADEEEEEEERGTIPEILSSLPDTVNQFFQRSTAACYSLAILLNMALFLSCLNAIPIAGGFLLFLVSAINSVFLFVTGKNIFILPYIISVDQSNFQRLEEAQKKQMLSRCNLFYWDPPNFSKMVFCLFSPASVLVAWLPQYLDFQKLSYQPIRILPISLDLLLCWGVALFLSMQLLVMMSFYDYKVSVRNEQWKQSELITSASLASEYW